MSHQPERKGKSCLNCGTAVIGRYCHVCGQENIETKESFWSLAKHFVFDIFHFDGKFFHTLQYLFARPGLVAREYCLGKRMSFLHPIRMYLFTSAIFFLIFSYANHMNFGENRHSARKLSKEDRRELTGDYRERLQENPKDTSIQKIIALLADTTKDISGSEIFALDPKPYASVLGSRYKSIEEYDSVQSLLPAGKKDGWLGRALMKKSIRLGDRYKGSPDKVFEIFWESFLHRLPYMLFLSLPFFALILKLLYIRRKNFYYSDHAIFTIYHYILSFILLLILFGISTLQDKAGWQFLSYLITLLVLAWPVYLLLEMKNFYTQGWGRTILKFFLLNIMGLMVILILFVAFLLFSVFEL